MAPEPTLTIVASAITSSHLYPAPRSITGSRSKRGGVGPRPNRSSGQETTLVAERPGPPVALVVPLPGPRAPHRPPRHLRLVGAFLGAVHGAGKGSRHPPGVGHRVNTPSLPPAGGASDGVARLGERAPLLERPAILTDKFVDRHLVSPLPSAVARPQISRGAI